MAAFDDVASEPKRPSCRTDAAAPPSGRAPKRPLLPSPQYPTNEAHTAASRRTPERCSLAACTCVCVCVRLIHNMHALLFMCTRICCLA